MYINICKYLFIDLFIFKKYKLSVLLDILFYITSDNKIYYEYKWKFDDNSNVVYEI